MGTPSVTSLDHPLLVRDIMTIGVPVCRDDETCGAVRARQAHPPVPVVVALDEDGIACGWLTLARLHQAAADERVGAVMDEVIPTVPPDIPAAAAAQLMGDRRVDYLFLMHDWPGELRPSAVISRQAIERRLADRID
jgi:CBS domain-containing protein